MGEKKHPGGRPLGSLNKKTLERKMVEKKMHQSIMNRTDRLLKIMMNQAEGEYFLMRVDETKSGKGKSKREHVIVTSGREIQKFFNEHAQDVESQEDLDGLSGTIYSDEVTEEDMDEENMEPRKGKYYYIKRKEADWRAIESLFDRVFGKSTQHISTDEGDKEEDKYEQLNLEQIDRHIDNLGETIKRARERIEQAKKAKREETKDTDTDDAKEGQSE